jgi:hypothetical protein
MAREKARGYEEGEEDARMRQTGQDTMDMLMAMGYSPEEARSIVAQGGHAARSGQGSVRVEPAGPTPNVNAAGSPVQVIGPNTPMNALPAPASVPTVGQEIAEEEKTPTGDIADHDGEYQTFGLEPQQQEGDEGMSEQQRKEIERQMMMQGRVGVQSSEPQGNTRQARLDDFTE